MTEYTTAIEDAGTNYAAYVIGLDGIIITGEFIDEVVENMREAIPFRLEGRRLSGGNCPDRSQSSRQFRSIPRWAPRSNARGKSCVDS
jgi:predicted RNase H-like HicB family nuclease